MGADHSPRGGVLYDMIFKISNHHVEDNKLKDNKPPTVHSIITWRGIGLNQSPSSLSRARASPEYLYKDLDKSTFQSVREKSRL